MQENIKINKVSVPVIIEESGGEIWYPISYIGKYVLLKELHGNQLIKNGYGEYIKQFQIDFGKNFGSIQEAYCINQEGLKIILSNSRIGGLNQKQKIAMNKMCQYLGLDINIDTQEQFLLNYPETKWSKYNFWEVECIKSILKYQPDIQWQRCSKCNKYYPYNQCFFYKETRSQLENKLRTKCNSCITSLRVKYYKDDLLTNTYYEDGEEWYKFIKNNRNIYEIYEYYNKNNNKIRYPNILKNSLLVGNIICKYYKIDILTNLDILNVDYLSKLSKIPKEYISLKMIDKNIINNVKRNELLKNSKINKNIESVKLKSITKNIKNITYDEAIENLNEYIIQNNIVITDIYNYDYYNLLQKTKVKYYLKANNIDTLEFIVNYYNWEYAPYKFSTVGTKFWHKKENSDKTLKYLIEKDMKLQIEKIPLYITKYSLRQKSFSLYNVIYKKRFDNNLYEWINRLYPGKFIEEDFTIGIIRNEFDSIEEKIIHDMLKQNFKNVIYNNRNSDNKITLLGMNPDWFIFTDNNIYIVEYFGIALDHMQYNKRISDYIDKSNIKINKYNNLPYAKKIFLYPEDIKGEKTGFYEKIKLIK